MVGNRFMENLYFILVSFAGCCDEACVSFSLICALVVRSFVSIFRFFLSWCWFDVYRNFMTFINFSCLFLSFFLFTLAFLFLFKFSSFPFNLCICFIIYLKYVSCILLFLFTSLHLLLVSPFYLSLFFFSSPFFSSSLLLNSSIRLLLIPYFPVFFFSLLLLPLLSFFSHSLFPFSF